MSRTDGIRALIAAGLIIESEEVARLADLVARDLGEYGPPVTREEAIHVALEKYVAGLLTPNRKTNAKSARVR